MCPLIFTAKCAVPAKLSGGNVMEGTVLTFPSCDIGLTQFGPISIVCLNNGEWNVDPETNKCLGIVTIIIIELYIL